MSERGLDHASHRLRVLIAAYLEKPLALLNDADLEDFAKKFCGYCNIEEKRESHLHTRDIKAWFDTRALYSDNQQSVVKFFQKRWPFFDQAMLAHDFPTFEEHFYAKLAAHLRTVVIELDEPLRLFTSEDRDFLCGVYELYRYAFSNDGQINIDVLILRSDPVNPSRLQVEIVINALRRDRKPERFRGAFCHYGKSLLGLPVLVKDHLSSLPQTNDSQPGEYHPRVRRYEFSDIGLNRTASNLVKIGILSGNSVQTGYPVAAKCLIAKVSNNVEKYETYLPVANRYRPEELYKPYVEAISNDVRKNPNKSGEQDDYLLIAGPVHPRLRPRDTFPPLPVDPDDPERKQWPNR